MNEIWTNRIRIYTTISLFMNLSIFLIYPSSAQQIFQKSFHNSDERVNDFQIVNDSTILLVGTYRNCWACPNELIVLKSDDTLKIDWAYKYTDSTVAHQIITLVDGYLISGFSDLSQSRDNYLLKLDFDGNVMWSKIYGTSFSDQGKIISVTSGGFLVAGKTRVTDSFGNDTSFINIFKINDSGTILWSEFYKVGLDVSISGIVEMPDSSFIINGSYVDSFLSPLNGVIFSVNMNGEILWIKKYSIMNDPFNITTFPLLKNGFIYLSGYTTLNNETHPLLMCITDTGSVLWCIMYQKQFGSTFPFSLIQLENSSFVISLGQGIIVMDSLGNFKESHTYIPNFPANSSYYQLQQTNDKGLLLGGYNTGMDDIFIVKTDSLFEGGCGFYTIAFNSIPILTTVNSLNYEEREFILTDTNVQTSMDTLPLTSFIYCSTATSISTYEDQEVSYLIVYPNPAQNILHIECNLNNDSAMQIIKLYNIQGILLNTYLTNLKSSTLNLQDIVPGVYIISSESKNGLLYSKFLKN